MTVTPAANTSSKTTFLSAFNTMGRVITAMILRETKTRFGRNKFGYVWALIEPAAYIAVFLVVRSQINATTPFGENLLLFLLTGLLTFRVFSSICTRSMSALSSNKAMLAYPPVKPMDIVFARIILETLTMFVMLFLFFAFLILTTKTKIIVNYENFAGALAALTLLSAGFGTFNAVFSMIWSTWNRIWTIIRLPILLLSGVFYIPNSLPPTAQQIVWWNPVLHAAEWLRTSTYLTYDPMLSKPYLIGFGVIFLTVGLALERLYRQKMIAS